MPTLLLSAPHEMRKTQTKVVCEVRSMSSPDAQRTTERGIFQVAASLIRGGNRHNSRHTTLYLGSK